MPMTMAQPNAPSASTPDRPERSRNAKAQARHRAKRKAYIEQLEHTVTKLQSLIALSPEQVAALPPQSQPTRIRQLEAENDKLLRENDELRRQLHLRRTSLVTNDPHFDIARRNSYQSSLADGYVDRDLKRRRTSDDVYLSPSQTPSPLSQEAVAPRSSNYSPPPLQPLPYMSSSTTTSAYPSPGLPSSTSVLSSGSGMHAPVGYHMHSTHHGSSASSPTSYSQPGHEHGGVQQQQQQHLHLPSIAGHAMPPPRAPQPPLHHGLAAPQYTSSQYDSVKVEEDNYIVSRPVVVPLNMASSQHYGQSPSQESPQTLHYPHSIQYSQAQELGSWHSYSADRTQIHH